LSVNLNHIEAENKKYGFHVYLGSLSNVATAYLCTLSIGYFANNIQLGFFVLALTISAPLSLLPNVIATTFFKNFADMERIPDKLIGYTIALCAVSYVVFALCLKKVVIFLYSTNYMESLNIAYILGLGMIIHGLGDMFNRFLCAKARGKDVRNGAFIEGGVNILAILLLVPIFRGTGAAMTRLLASIAYLMAMYLYYRRCNVIAEKNQTRVIYPS
jgi:O-antigen/teichoic acid export membrane protein